MGNWISTTQPSAIMLDVHPVTFALNNRARTYTADFQTEAQFGVGWQSVLKAAYGRAELRCACKGIDAKRLSVKYYEGSDQFSLVRFSLTDGEHAPECQYYSANPAQFGVGGVASEVIDPRAVGSSRSASRSLCGTRRDSGAGADYENPTDRAPADKQSSMKLLGLPQ